jgi:hypothetical protein
VPAAPRRARLSRGTQVVINDEAHARLLSAGLDARLAQHVAHLFCRDPLVIFSGEGLCSLTGAPARSSRLCPAAIACPGCPIPRDAVQRVAR